MLEQLINSFSYTMSRTKLTSAVLSTPKMKIKLIKKMKNLFESTFLKTKPKSFKVFSYDVHNNANSNSNSNNNL